MEILWIFLAIYIFALLFGWHQGWYILENQMLDYDVNELRHDEEIVSQKSVYLTCPACGGIGFGQNSICDLCNGEGVVSHFKR